MAYDQGLADRIRRMVGDDGDTTERKMFGGLAFMVNGHMAVVASGQGGVMVRVDSAASDGLVANTPASVAEMRGRPMRGWLRIGSQHLETDERLARWVHLATTHARTLPAKQ